MNKTIKKVLSKLRFRRIITRDSPCYIVTSTPNQSFRLTRFEHEGFELDSSRHQRHFTVLSSSECDHVEELFFNRDSKKSSLRADERFIGSETLDGDLFATCREEKTDPPKDAYVQVGETRHEISSDGDGSSTSADSGACGSTTDTATCRQKLLSTLQILQNKEETLALQAASLQEAEERISQLSATNRQNTEQLQRTQKELSVYRRDGQGATGPNETCVAFGKTQEVDQHKTIIRKLQNNLSVIEELYKECFYESAKQEQLIEMLRQSYLDVRIMERSKEEELVRIKKMLGGNGDVQWTFDDLSSEVEKLKTEISIFLTSSSNGSSSNNDSGMWERSEDGSLVAELSDDLRYIVTQLETLRDILVADCCRAQKDENKKLKNQIKELQAEITELNGQVSQLETELQEKNQNIEYYENILQEKSDKRRTAKLFDKLKQTNKAKEKEISCLRKRVLQLEKSMVMKDDGFDGPCGMGQVNQLDRSRQINQKCINMEKDVKLQEKVKELEKDLMVYRKRVKELEDLAVKHECDAASREEKFEDKQALEKRNCQLIQENTDLNKRCMELEKNIEELTKRVCDVDQCEINIEDTFGITQPKRTAKDHKSSGKIKELEKELKSYRKRVKELEDLAVKHECEVVFYKDKLDEKQQTKECNQLMCEKNNQLNQRCMEMEKEIEELTGKLCDMEMCVMNKQEFVGKGKQLKLSEKNKELEKELKRYRNRVKELEALAVKKECDLVSAQDTLNEKQQMVSCICELREKNDRLETENETLQEELEELKNRLCNFEECAMQHNENEECTCKRDFIQYNGEIIMLKSNIENLQQQLRATMNSLTMKDKLVNELQDKIRVNAKDNKESHPQKREKRLIQMNKSLEAEVHMFKKHIREYEQMIAQKDEYISQLQKNVGEHCKCNKRMEEFKQLVQINETAQYEIFSLNQRVKELERTLQDKDRHIQELRNPTDERNVRTECDCSKKESSKMKQFRESYQHEINCLKQKTYEFENCLKEKDQIIQELQNKPRKTKASCTDDCANTEVQILQDSCQCQRESDITTLKNRVCDLETCIQEKEKYIQDLQTKMDEKRIDCASKRECLKEKVSYMENEILGLKSKIQDLEQDVLEKNNCISAKDAELEEGRNKLCSLTCELDEIKRTLMENCSVKCLRQSLQEALDRLAERTKEMEDLQKQVMDFKQNETNACSVRQKLKEMEIELQEKERVCKLALQEKEKQISELKEKICTIENCSRISLLQQQEIETLAQKLKDAEEALSGKSEELQTLQHKCNSQDLEIKHLKDELNNADKIIMESKKLRSEVVYLTQQVSLWREQLEQSQQTVRELREKLTLAKEQYRQLEDDYKSKQESSYFLQRELEAATARGAELCGESRRVLSAVRDWTHHVHRQHKQQSQKMKEQQATINSLRRLQALKENETERCTDVQVRPRQCDADHCGRVSQYENHTERTRQCDIDEESATDTGSCTGRLPPNIRLLRRKAPTFMNQISPMWQVPDPESNCPRPGSSHPSPTPVRDRYGCMEFTSTTPSEAVSAVRGELGERAEGLRAVRGEVASRWGRRHPA